MAARGVELVLQSGDLLREIDDHRHVIARLRHAVNAGSEKGTHVLNEAKRQLARMLTVLSSLRRKKSFSTMPAPTAPLPVPVRQKAAPKK